ncbi:hypothetical protein BDZ89DRAFT_1055749 [Hymenopellis radicata]|nr:hypothetical protein BDZ89DRAFT_1055749 [Hymenopellis radicata]
MSDNERPQAGSKKRRLQGACDLCRQKKIKCDSAKMPDNKCSNCVAFNSDCTHVAALSKKPGRWHQGHVSETPIAPKEDIQVHIKSILSTSVPYVVPKDQAIVRAVLVDLARYARLLEAEIASLKVTAEAPEPYVTDSDSDLDENTVHLTSPLRHLTVSEHPNRHFGKSAAIMLVKNAIDVKKLIWPSIPPPSGRVRREEFWTVFPWQRLQRDYDPPHDFPPSDLLDSLVDIYLSNLNDYLSHIHGPTFRREIAAGTHHISHEFGNLVLCVCAVASRYSSDPRVGLGHQAGWAWYRQIRVNRPTERTTPPCLWEVQVYPLMALFLFGSATPEPCWLLVAAGVRLCQDVGAHRRRPLDPHEWTCEDEQWKRTFWAHVTVDTLTSSITGKPRATTSEHYDLAYPLEVDDDYWPGEALADPKKPWTQPIGVQASSTALILHLKLLEILGFAQNTIYALNRPVYWDAMSAPEWDRKIAVHLDSALNKWVDSLPEHLRWDDNIPNDRHFNQSAMLYTSYFWVQTHIHRPFLPRVKANASCGGTGLARGLEFPSMVICSNAARFCCHVLYSHSLRGIMPLPHMLVAVFHSAVLILLHSWAGKHVSLPGSPARNAEDIRKCMAVLAHYEARYQVAGRYHDVLRELFEGTQPEAEGPTARKRPLEEADINPEDNGVRSMAAPAEQNAAFSELPLRTDDLLAGWNLDSVPLDTSSLDEFMGALLMQDGMTDSSWLQALGGTYSNYGFSLYDNDVNDLPTVSELLDGSR